MLILGTPERLKGGRAHLGVGKAHHLVRRALPLTQQALRPAPDKGSALNPLSEGKVSL